MAQHGDSTSSSSSTSIVAELCESRTFLDLRDITDDSPKPCLRRVKSTGDLPSPRRALPTVDIGANIATLPSEEKLTLLGIQTGESTTSKKSAARRRNRRANLGQEGETTQQIAADGLANALREARSSQAVLAIAGENMERLDFRLVVLAVHIAAKNAAANPDVCTGSTIFQTLVHRMHLEILAVSIPSTSIASLLIDALYSFGKLDVHGFDCIIYDISKAMPPCLNHCSTVQLSTALWSLGRLAPVEAPNTRMTQEARQLAILIMGQIANRPLEELTPHCMSEVLYAKARLELQGKQVQNFVEACKRVICGRAHLQDFSTQGLANMAWALAKTHLKMNRSPSGVVSAVSKTTGEVSLKIMNDARGRLDSFEMLELSMTAWAITKLHAKNEGGLAPESQNEVGTFISAVAEESVKRFELMSSQSISNVAWALTKLDRMSDSSARSFFTKAMTSLIARPQEFSPQAISNLCYAVSWLNSRSKARAPRDFRDSMQCFAEVAAYQCLTREVEFKWQDLSGVLVAIAPRFQQDDTPLGRGPYTRQLAEKLGRRVAQEGYGLSTQVGLNIAVAASRIGLPPDILRHMTCTMSSVIASRTPRVNGHDLRQFKELQDYADVTMEKFQ